jgi:hypothetical protein
MEEELKQEIIQLIKDSEEKDSLEWGTPGKTGCLKVYGNLNKEDEFKKKIETGIKLLIEGNLKIKGD